MDQLKWATPIKEQKEHENFTIKSPVIFKTPVKQNGTFSKHRTSSSSMSCFSVLPSHITPPSGLTKFIARNPFETDLTNRLHLSVISPTVFKKVSSSPQQSPDFAWSVDELALIQPAKIEEFPTQQIHNVDPEIEIKAQAAIDKFFKENEIIPSPWELKRKESRAKIKMETPTRPVADINLDNSKSKKDGWTQTVLTFPTELPPHVMEILKPYFTFTQDQNTENDDANSSNSSLRRKLFFNHEDCADNEEDSSDYLSPMKINGSLAMPSSPPQSGMLVHGAALNHSRTGACNHNTSQIISANLSPPNISPIHSTVNNMSCESLKLRSRSVARLDFTNEMSIDEQYFREKDSSKNRSLEESFTGEEIQVSKKEAVDLTSVETYFTCNKADIEDKAEILEKDKILFDCNVDNIILGISDQQSVSNSVQDTGYQTYSMINTTNVIDNHCNTPLKQKGSWGDKILTNDQDFRLPDWKENMENIFSSTPSRSNREKDNRIR